MPNWMSSALEYALDFSNILNASISASWLILLVIALRLVMKQAPKWVNVALWGIVALRLLMPFSIESDFSLIPSAQTVSDRLMQAETVAGQQSAYLDIVTNPAYGGSVSVELDTTISAFQWELVDVTFLWLAGMAVMVLYTVVTYWRLRRKVDTAVILRDNIFQSEYVTSPFVLGIVNPRIYLPFQMNGQDLIHVIAHEQAHIRRKDHWWKPLGFLLLTIHWFNPLMWIAYILLCRDIELACDEKVIRELGSDQRADYTQALVASSVNRRMIAACPLAFGEVGVKERVKSIMNYRKPAFLIIVTALVVCVVVAVCFLTDPPTADDLAQEPFNHRYSVREIAYADLRYSFSYTTSTAPKYDLTSDYQLFVTGDVLNSSNPADWVQHPGYFQEITLTKGNFDDCFVEPSTSSGWNGVWNRAERLRSQVKQAWRLDVKGNPNGVFYYLLQTQNGDVLLCYGYDNGESQAGIVERTLIRWVFVLEPGLDPEAPVSDGEIPVYEPKGVSDTNVIELRSVPDDVQWLDGISFAELAPGEEILSDFEIIFEEEDTSMLLTISWSRASLYLEYGIRRDDGTEFFQEKRGGYSHLQIDDIPAGTYRLYIKNSDAYAGIPAYENPAAFEDVSFDATGAMNYALKGKGHKIIDYTKEQGSSVTMIPTETKLKGLGAGALLLPMDGHTYRYLLADSTPEGVTADELLFSFQEIDMGERILNEVYSLKEYPDRSKVLLISAKNGPWLCEYSPPQRCSDTALTDAVEAGYVVMEDGYAAHNQKVWQEFFENTRQGSVAEVTIADYWKMIFPSSSYGYLQVYGQDYPSLHTYHLSFDGTNYTLTFQSGTELHTRTYEHLMRYDSDSIRYVLTHDNTVTWDQIFHGMVSSQTGASIDHYSIYTERKS